MLSCRLYVLWTNWVSYNVFECKLMVNLGKYGNEMKDKKKYHTVDNSNLKCANYLFPCYI